MLRSGYPIVQGGLKKGCALFCPLVKPVLQGFWRTTDTLRASE